jgi:hypothetical protein
MRFLTVAESRLWCEQSEIRLTATGSPERPSTEPHHVRAAIPQSFTKLTWFCQHLERSLQPRDTCLAWVTVWGVWASSENLHLYYKLRQSYGDVRLLHEAPGHVFLRHEVPDLVSFLEVGIICGWDIHLLPTVAYARAFVSHDEYVEYASDDSNPTLVTDFGAPLAKNAEARPNAPSA